MFLFLLALLAFLLALACSLEIAVGMNRMTGIGEVSLPEGKDLPRVSVIIPARNEAQTMGPALRSVLDLDYPDLEVIVVNDRSSDGTWDVIRRVGAGDKRLTVIDVHELPPDWLGKNHALSLGAARATGGYLLFTDADIVMERSVLQRAVGHMLQHGFDHLSMFFDNVAEGGLLNASFMDVAGGLLLLFKPWKAKDPESRYFMGVGAFNLVKASAYRETGGHAAIAMHPIDDIMLGKRLKEHGFRQDCLLGNHFITVRWYGTIREFVNGVMKNTFAVYDYSVLRVLTGVLFMVILAVLPFWGSLFAAGAATRLLFAGAVLARILSFSHGFSSIGLPRRYAVWSLLSPYINIYIVVKATVSTLINGGINWRGTTYPLEKLKKQKFFS